MRSTLVLVSLLAACGSSTTTVGIGNDVDPEKFEGGGAGGGAIDGRLNLYLYDEDTEEPVQGATVLVGDGQDPDLVGETDEDGLVTFRKAGLEGPIDVTFGKSGYHTSTIVGLDAANFTSGMDADGASPAVGTATITGTVAGVADLPAPTETEIYAGLVGFAVPRDQERQDVEQPEGNHNIVANGFGPETFELLVPAGEVTLVSYLVRVILNGPGDTDNEIEYLSIGLLRGVEAAEGETVDAGEIPEVADVSETLATEWPAPVIGTDRVRGLAAVDLGEDGLIPFLNPGDPDAAEFPVPPLEGELGDATYLILAAATDSEAQADADASPGSNLLVPTSSRILRGFDSASDPPALPALLALPSSMGGEGRTFSFEAISAANVYGVNFREPGDDEPTWGVAVLDGATTSFTLPDVPSGLADLPSGEVEMRVSAITVSDFDPQAFVANELEDDLDASSADGATFQP